MTEAATLADVKGRVLALQRPVEAQQAAAWLAQFQRTPGAVQLCATLLGEALQARDTAAAFFAAHTIAERARLPDTNSACLWATLAMHVCHVLRASAAREIETPGVVLRQLCSALVRLAMWLVEEWPTAIEDILALPHAPDATPLVESLFALAEEAPDRRLPLDPPRRSRFILTLQSRTPEVMKALGAITGTQPSARTLQVAAAWLRAQLSFEEWLPSISFCAGTHPALCSITPLLPFAARAARLEVDLESLKASSEVYDAMLSLTTDLSQGDAVQVVMPLLSAFGSAFAKLPSTTVDSSAELLDIRTALMTVLYTTFTSVALLKYNAVWQGMIEMGTQLLLAAGSNKESLLDSALDAWEGLAITYNGAKEEGVLDDAALAQEKTFSAFKQLLSALPIALLLPSDLQNTPDESELRQLRSKATRMLLAWCGTDDAFFVVVMEAVRASLQNLPPPGADLGAKWADLEVTLWLAASAGQVAYRSSVRSFGPQPAPELLTQLLMNLPRLPRTVQSSAHWVLISATAADFVCALDPWITPELLPPSAENFTALLTFLFDVAGEPQSLDPTADALAVVISNFAPALAMNEVLGAHVLQQTTALSLSSKLPVARREKLVESALGPLLSCLPPEQLEAAFRELTAMLSSAGNPPQVSVRLLFHVISAPQPSDPAPQLRTFAAQWPCFEAALTKWVASQPVVEAACNALTSILSRAQSCAGVPEILCRAIPLLAEAAAKQGSAPALSALAMLVRIFDGGPTEEIAALLAKNTLSVLDALLRDGAPQAAQLPSDLITALQELLATALAEKCSALALLLLQQQCALTAAVMTIAGMLPNLTSPQAACWSLRACAQLPMWLQRPESHHRPAAAGVLQAALPGLAGAWCRLVASSPVVRDPEVLTTLARVLLGTARAVPEPMRLATGQAMAEIEVEVDKREVLLLRLGDPATTEASLAQVLWDTVDAWQAQNTRRLLMP